jgi:hypothetical protein
MCVLLKTGTQNKGARRSRRFDVETRRELCEILRPIAKPCEITHGSNQTPDVTVLLCAADPNADEFALEANPE